MHCDLVKDINFNLTQDQVFLGGLDGHIGDIIKLHVRDQLLINTYVSSGNDSHRSGEE